MYRVGEVEVVSGKRLRMKTRCFNQDKVLVIDGEAMIVPPPPGRTTGTCSSERSA